VNQWWKNSVVYQIYPRSFQDSNGDGIGDIQGIISRLDYLKELGIDVIWLSPVYESPNDDNGYDISDYEQIMADFGTMKDMERLISEIHHRDMKLLMDLVVNHTSDEHQWFVEARKSKDSPYRDYYIWRPGQPDVPPTDWESNFSGSAWEYDETTGEYYLHLFSKKQPDLNWENETMRKAVYHMMEFWLNKGIDGFRMDVINMISKKEFLPSYEEFAAGTVKPSNYRPNGETVHDYLQEMNREVLSKYDTMTVGECPSVTPDQALLYTAEERAELNMVFQFEHMGLDKQKGRSKWELKPLELMDLKENLTKWQKKLETEGWNSLYWSNHDQPRTVSRFGNDQTYRIVSAKMLATLLHMMKGTPYIYQGEEIGMTNVPFTDINQYKDIETLNMYKERVHEKGYAHEDVMKSILAKSRDNARTPMQWSNKEQAGFTIGTPWIEVNPNYEEINVEQALADPESIFYHYQKLIALRKHHSIIVNGSYDLILPDHPSIFAYVRTWGKQKLLVINNFYEEETTFEPPAELSELEVLSSALLISNYETNHEGPLTSIPLRAYESRAYLLEIK